jgi:hypothetical protein
MLHSLSIAGAGRWPSMVLLDFRMCGTVQAGSLVLGCLLLKRARTARVNIVFSWIATVTCALACCVAMKRAGCQRLGYRPGRCERRFPATRGVRSLAHVGERGAGLGSWSPRFLHSMEKCSLPQKRNVPSRRVSLIESAGAWGISKKGWSGSECRKRSSWTSPQWGQ